MRLEAHADLVNDLEARLSLTAGRSCSTPTLAQVGSKNDYAVVVPGHRRQLHAPDPSGVRV